MEEAGDDLHVLGAFPFRCLGFAFGELVVAIEREQGGVNGAYLGIV